MDQNKSTKFDIRYPRLGSSWIRLNLRVI